MNSFLDIDGVKSEYIFGLKFLLLLWISLFFGVCFEVIFNDAGKGSISNSSGDLFSAIDACIFFIIDEFSEASPTESVIARLDSNWDRHDLIAEGAGYLLFNWFGKIGWRCFILFLLLLLLLLHLLALFLLHLLRLFLLNLLFLLLFLFLLLLFDRLEYFNFHADGLIEGHFVGIKKPDLAWMRKINSDSLANFFVSNEGPIGA